MDFLWDCPKVAITVLGRPDYTLLFDKAEKNARARYGWIMLEGLSGKTSLFKGTIHQEKLVPIFFVQQMYADMPAAT